MKSVKLYHRVPQSLKFEELIPLNQLEDLDKPLYSKYNAKYLHRPELKKRRVPFLDCRWNDVLHTTAVHPLKVKKALASAGFEGVFHKKWFEICPLKNGFNENNSIIYLYPEIRMPLDKSFPEDFARFNLDSVGKYQHLPQGTIQHYHEAKRRSERPFFFLLVPHILYMGRLKLSQMNIIEI